MRLGSNKSYVKLSTSKSKHKWTHLIWSLMSFLHMEVPTQALHLSRPRKARLRRWVFGWSVMEGLAVSRTTWAQHNSTTHTNNHACPKQSTVLCPGHIKFMVDPTFHISSQHTHTHSVSAWSPTVIDLLWLYRILSSSFSPSPAPPATETTAAAAAAPQQETHGGCR